MTAIVNKHENHRKPKLLYSLLGHTAKSFNVKFSRNGADILSASEDSTAKLWNAAAKRKVFSFQHDKNAEVLRIAFADDNNSKICTCSADGTAILWGYDIATPEKIAYVPLCTLPHGDAQIYACEILQHASSDGISNSIITAADDCLYQWNLETYSVINTWRFSQSNVYINGNSESGADNEGLQYGGPRNPDNMIYIFDAKVATQNSVAVALSDGSVACIDNRSSSSVSRIFLKNLSGISNLLSSHATSVNWTPDCLNLLVSLGNGNVAIVDSRMGSLRAVLSDHKSCSFGTSFFNTCSSSSHCISWSSDCTIKLWDVSIANGIIDHAIDGFHLEDFPIYDCAINPVDNSIACAGGGVPSFLGYPIQVLKAFDSLPR